MITLQLKWDMHLIHWFHTKSQYYMSQCIRDFEKKYGVEIHACKIEERTILRTPITYHQNHTKVGPYISTYLPKLNNILWATQPTDAFDIALKLGNYDVKDRKANPEFRELRRGRKQYIAATMSHVAEQKWWNSFSGKDKYTGVRKA